MSFLLNCLHSCLTRSIAKWHTRYVFGCRKPGTEIGGWDGAFVSEFKICDLCNYAIFQDQLDYVGRGSILKASNTYYYYIDQGWLPMTLEDMQKTAGVMVEKACSPPLRYTEYLYIVVGLCGLVVTLFFLIKEAK